MFGAGVQARVLVEAVRVVRPIQTVWVVGRTRATAEALVAELIASGLEAAIPAEAEAAGAAGAASDIFLTATSAGTPAFAGQALRPGTHVTAVGAHTPETRELDEACFRFRYNVLNSFAAALAEAGDLLLVGAEPQAELSQIVLGTRPGRVAADQSTIFESVGIAAQDAAAAGAVLRALAPTARPD